MQSSSTEQHLVYIPVIQRRKIMLLNFTHKYKKQLNKIEEWSRDGRIKKYTNKRQSHLLYIPTLAFLYYCNCAPINHGWHVCWVRYVGDIRAGAGSSLVVTMVRVYQFWFNRIITGYFCTPQKASVGMYSRCDCLLFVYFLILPSLLHSSILFNCFLYLFLFFFIALSVIYQCHLTWFAYNFWLSGRWEVRKILCHAPH